jgi:hypothetical protein
MYLAAVFLGLSATLAHGVDFGDIAVTVDPVPAGNSLHGYTEYVFSIVNKSATNSHGVTLSLPKETYRTSGDRIRSITRAVDVGPNSTARISLFQPFQPMLMGMGVDVRIDDREQRDGLSLNLSKNYGRGYSYRYPMYAGTMGAFGSGEHLVLLSRSVDRDFPTKASMLSSMTSFVVNPEQFPVAEGPVSKWSTNWLGYSRYDGIVVTGADMRDMPAAVRTALYRYAESGGSLLILGNCDLAESWKRRHQDFPGGTVYYPAFGQCLLCASGEIGQVPEVFRSELSRSWNYSLQPWKSQRSAAAANDLFPVVKDLGVPVRGLFLLMIVFAVTIGPLNLYLLTRWKRRIWMLWTAPAISLVTCLAVFGYMILVEGWEGHLRTDTLTILDESTQRAASIGWTAFYSPLTPSAGLHFSQEIELTAQIEEEGWRSSGGFGRTINWSSDQQLASGWLTARIPAHFMLRKNENRRERVTIQRGTAGAYTMANLLGANLSAFWYADDNGTVYTAGAVAAGGHAGLTPAAIHLKPSSDLLRQLYSREWLQGASDAVKNPENYLLPRTYLAILDESPFVEDGLRHAKHRQYRSLVLGILKEAGDES